MVRVIACDDGRIKKLGGGYTTVVCISWSSESGLEDISIAPVHIDGLDATSILAYLIKVISTRDPIDAIMLDSLTIAGFNIVSPDTLSKKRGSPVIIVYNYEPSVERLNRGLIASGLNLINIRMNILKIINNYVKINTRMGPLYILTWKTNINNAIKIIELSQVVDRMPAPLRFAHYIASAISRILSV